MRALADVFGSELKISALELLKMRKDLKYLLRNRLVSHKNIILKELGIDGDVFDLFVKIDDTIKPQRKVNCPDLRYLTAKTNETHAKVGMLKRKGTGTRKSSMLYLMVYDAFNRHYPTHYIKLTRKILRRHGHVTTSHRVNRTLKNMVGVVDMGEGYYRFDRILYNRHNKWERRLK